MLNTKCTAHCTTQHITGKVNLTISTESIAVFSEQPHSYIAVDRMCPIWGAPTKCLWDTVCRMADSYEQQA